MNEEMIKAIFNGNKELFLKMKYLLLDDLNRNSTNFFHAVLEKKSDESKQLSEKIRLIFDSFAGDKQIALLARLDQEAENKEPEAKITDTIVELKDCIGEFINTLNNLEKQDW